MAGLKFRVLLDSVKNQEIFRDILIDENMNFEQFYLAIIDAFNLSNDQMASIYVSDEAWSKGEEISLLDMSFDEVDGESPIEMRNLALNERINNLNQRFILVHDFLSMWIFLIELDSVTEKAPEMPELVLSIGEIPEELKEKGAHEMDDLKFDTDYEKSSNGYDYNGFDDDDDDFDEDEFEDIDDFDF